MTETKSQSNVLATGFAMFSMFFGAGNVVFPLALGLWAQNFNVFAIIGLLITAIGVPFLGLMSMTLFDGNYKSFFGRLGKAPGFLIALAIMGLIGPFGALPRCIALSYSTTTMFFPGISIELFSFLSCVLIFLFTFKKNNIIDILGVYLTPFLLLSLGIIIVKGIFFSPAAPESEHTALAAFIHGLTEGYQTMDLLGAFFFSSVVISCLKKDPGASNRSNSDTIKIMGKASLIGASLLALIYIGFSYISAFNAAELASMKTDQLLGHIALKVLGPYAGIVACAAVALACLTTAIALACVFSEFLHFDITNGKLNYFLSLIITLIISYFVSIMNFNEIIAFLAPILQTLYPALIALSVFNLIYKLFGYKSVKTPVLGIFLLTLFVQRL